MEVKMVKHVVSWNYAEGFTVEENQSHALQIKQELEQLKSLIPGIVSLEVFINPLEASSDKDILLDSVFESEAALQAYVVHTEHVRVGTNFVKPFTRNRSCIDVVYGE
jgi:hypothetical protein